MHKLVRLEPSKDGYEPHWNAGKIVATQSELSRKPFPMLFLLVRFMSSNRFCVDEAATFELSVVKVKSKIHVKFTVAYELNLKI